jgi:hypothetical protein
LGDPHAANRTVRPAWQREGRLYVIGVDGLSPDVVRAMGAQALPAFRRLEQDGCSGPLATTSPTASPLLWTTIATGRHHAAHGVDDFKYYRVGSRRVSHYRLKKGSKLRKWLVRTLHRLGLAPVCYFDSRDVRTKTFWDIADAAGMQVGVANWWHTWPAFPVNGFVASDRLIYWRNALESGRASAETKLTYPEDLLARLRPLIVGPEDVPTDDICRFVDLPDEELREFMESDFRLNELRGELRFLIASDESVRRVLQHCLVEFPGTRVVAAYFRCTDIAQHCAYQFAPWAKESSATEDARTKFGGAVPEAYRMADRLVGGLMDRMAPEDTLLVVSDHGFAYMDERRGYGHRYGEPPGVFYGFGPEFESGARARGLTVYDVAPTVLRVCGLPAAKDMPGRCPEDILSAAFRHDHAALDRIPSYGGREDRRDRTVQPREVTRDIEKHLQGLGYWD